MHTNSITRPHKTSDVIGRPYGVGGGGVDLTTTTVVSSSTAHRAIGAATFTATGAGAGAALGVCTIGAGAAVGVCTIGAGAAGRVLTGDGARLMTRECVCVRGSLSVLCGTVDVRTERQSAWSSA